MKLLNPDNSVLMEVSALRRDVSTLVVRGSIMGAMPDTPCRRRARRAARSGCCAASYSCS